jgi:hypothetical protein
MQHLKFARKRNKQIKNIDAGIKPFKCSFREYEAA